MSSKPTDDLKDFEKVRQNDSMRTISDRKADDVSDAYDDHPEDEYWEDEIDLDDDPGAGIFKKLMPIGLGLIAVSIVGGGILIMLGDSSPKHNIPEAIPLIEAETTPEKTKPETPGGMVIPHQDKLVLNEEGEGNKTIEVEKLLPPPEVPQPPKAEEVVTELPVAEIQKKEIGEAVSDKVVEATKQASEITPIPEKKTSEIESVLAPKVSKKPHETSKLIKTETPKSTATAPVPTQAQVLTKPVSGQYILQLASLKSKEGAMTEWKNMQRKLSSLLGDKQPIIEKASISGVGVRYRLQTGPFADKKAASNFCAKLKSVKRDCLVKKVK